jgi:thiosulfate/3-mercaptopyruvate sulfurtransferase
MKTLITTIITAILFCCIASAEENYKGFARSKGLITPAELNSLIEADETDLVIIAVVKESTFRKGHIPGAMCAWRPDYERKTDDRYAFGGMMVNAKDFQTFARSLGINNDSQVVIYDHKYDSTRLWWAFYLYGKYDCRILDGGYQGWEAAGYEVSRRTAKRATGDFTAAKAMKGWTASMYDVHACVDGSAQLWDTREEDEWLGSKLKRGAFSKGRIPWAAYQNWGEFKKKVSKDAKYPTEFKSASEVAAVVRGYGMDMNKEQIFYCQSGVRTTTAIFSLYLLGWPVDKLKNYDGSWIEWSYHEDNPSIAGKPTEDAIVYIMPTR